MAEADTGDYRILEETQAFLKAACARTGEAAHDPTARFMKGLLLSVNYFILAEAVYKPARQSEAGQA